MTLFFKTHFPCQDSQYFTWQIPASNKGITRIFSVFPVPEISPTMSRVYHPTWDK
jgi:hypothetical protein